MKLSESIAFVRTMYVHPAKSLLAQWQDQAEKLEARVASVEHTWVRDTRDLKEVITARYQDISDLKRDASELRRMNGTQAATIKSLNADAASLNKRIADIGREAQRRGDENGRLEAALKGLKQALADAELRVSLANQQAKDAIAAASRHHSTWRQLEDQNKNLEAALVKAETDVKERDEQIDRLKRMYDTDITARNADVRWLSKEREELKEQLDKQAKVLLLRCDGLVCLTNKMERQIHDLIQQRSFLRRKLEQMTQRNDNQSGSIRGYQEEVRKPREQLEAEKAKPARVIKDQFERAEVEVKIFNAEQIDVIERTDESVRVRRAMCVTNAQPRVQRRSVVIDSVDLKTGQVLGTVTEYGTEGKPLCVFTGVPINGLIVTTGA